MSETSVFFYMESDGSVPVLDWLKRIGKRDPRIAAKCVARIEELERKGLYLRRPLAEYLRDGIYELRIHYGHMNIRILYFFENKSITILAHGLFKEDRVPDKEIDIAVMRKNIYKKDPQRHRYEEK